MAFATALQTLPLLLLVACESKPNATTAQSVATHTPKPIVPLPPKAARDSVQTFSWQDDVCTNTGTFAAGAYTQQQLRGTHQLVNGFMTMTSMVPFSSQNYNDAFFHQAARKLTHEHDSLARVLRNLQVVPTKFWQKIKRLSEAELAERYALDQITLEGYFHPASWLSNSYYAPCPEYATALAATDTAVVLKAWRKLVD